MLCIKHYPTPHCSTRSTIDSEQFGEPGLDISKHLRTEAETTKVSLAGVQPSQWGHSQGSGAGSHERWQPRSAVVNGVI